MKPRYIKFLGILLFVTTWWIASLLYKESVYFLSSPLDVFLSLKNCTYQDVGATLYRWAFGFIIGAVAGICIGLIIGLIPTLGLLCELPFEMFRSTPPAAILPIFFIFFGVGDKAKIAIAVFPTFFITVLSVSKAVLSVSETRLQVLKIMNANLFQKIRYVIFPEILPQVLLATKISLSLSLTVAIVAEMLIGSEFGLGQRIYDAYLTSNISALYASVVIASVIGTLFNQIINLYYEKVSVWLPKS